MPTWRCAIGLVLALSTLTAGAARAEEAEVWRRPLSDRVLNDIRGGFVTADGVTFVFGVSLQTFVNGQLALTSNLSVTGDGAPLRSVAAPDAGALSQSAHAALLTLGSGAANTTLLQQLGGGGIQNVVSTSASNQVIAQNTNLNLTLAGFQQNQQVYQTGQIISNLTSQLNFAMSTVHH